MEVALVVLVLAFVCGVLALENIPPLQRRVEAFVRKLQGAGEPVVGAETLAGATATLIEPTTRKSGAHFSRVRIGGELWTVRLTCSSPAGRCVRVLRTGTILEVVPTDES